jgi:hypothetical protein
VFVCEIGFYNLIDNETYDLVGTGDTPEMAEENARLHCHQSGKVMSVTTIPFSSGQ